MSRSYNAMAQCRDPDRGQKRGCLNDSKGAGIKGAGMKGARMKGYG